MGTDMSTVYGSNAGLQKAMGLDTLGNAYLYLRQQFANTSWASDEGLALMDAAQILRDAFTAVKTDFALIDFTDNARYNVR